MTDTMPKLYVDSILLYCHSVVPDSKLTEQSLENTLLFCQLKNIFLYQSL